MTIGDVVLAEGNAGTTNFVFNVTLTRPVGNNGAVSVQYVTADDAATAGGAQPDYSATGPVTLNFAAGVTSQQIVIPVNGDPFMEPDEAFFVHLLNPVGALLTRSRAIGLIQDDDGGLQPPLVLVNDVVVDPEGDSGSSTATVTLTLATPALAPVSITLSTADGTARAGRDYSATTTTLNIPVGAMSGTASIPILGDTRDELAEFFTVNLFAPSNALLTATSLQVTIRDDDGRTYSTPNDCVLTGGDGNDTANGGIGNDTLNGGAGVDSLSGGAGSDSILGGASADSIDGGDGNDTLDAGDGSDTVIGGDGNDSIIGGLGNDGLNGGHGHDTINGGAGRDSILGGDGNDVLLGGADSDTLLGNDGDDTVNGQGSTDVLAGNEGTDLLNDATSNINEAFTFSAAVLSALEA